MEAELTVELRWTAMLTQLVHGLETVRNSPTPLWSITLPSAAFIATTNDPTDPTEIGF